MCVVQRKLMRERENSYGVRCDTVSHSVSGCSGGDMPDSLSEHSRLLTLSTFAEIVSQCMFFVVVCHIMLHHCWMRQQDSAKKG